MVIGDGNKSTRSVIPQTNCTKDMTVELGPSVINTIADFLKESRTVNDYKWDSNGKVDFCSYEEPKRMSLSVVIEIISAQ